MLPGIVISFFLLRDIGTTSRLERFREDVWNIQ